MLNLILVLFNLRCVVCKLGPTEPLTILHTNDIHSHYDPTNKFGTDCSPKQIREGNCFGGVARLKAAVDQVRQAHPNSLFLDAGDQFQGTMYYTYFKGNVTWEVMNRLQYDAMAIGNHEFDNGPDNLARVIKEFDFPVVCANMDTSSEPKLNGLVKPYIYLPEYDIAIIGYITETTGQLSNVGLGLKFTDPIVAVQNAIDDLNSRGINRIIALSHNGYTEDIDLASHTRGLSLIVGGHSHSYLAPNDIDNRPNSYGPYPTIAENLDGELVYVVQAYCWGRFLGHLDLTFREDGYIETIQPQLIELTMDFPEDSSMSKLINKMKHEFEDMGRRLIGNATQDFTVGHCQSQECAMGNLLTDAMLFRHRADGADIALINSGGIRASFSEGPITVQNVLAVLPFENYVVQFSMSGSEIWNMIKSVIQQYNTLSSLSITSFIQVSGIQFSFDSISRSLLEVQIFNATLNKLQPLESNKLYSIVTADFIASGGDNIIFPPRSNLTNLELQSQGLMDHIALSSPVKPSLYNRIVSSSTSSKEIFPVLTNDIPSHVQFKHKRYSYQPASQRQVTFSRKHEH